MHQPTAAFRASLESELRRSLRQPGREPGRATRPGGRLRFAALVILSLGLGGASGIVYGQVQDARRRDVMIDAKNTELRTAAARLDLLRATLDDAQARFDAGVLTRAGLVSARAELTEAEMRAARVRLDLEEIRASALEPRNDLAAPLVGTRGSRSGLGSAGSSSRSACQPNRRSHRSS